MFCLTLSQKNSLRCYSICLVKALIRSLIPLRSLVLLVNLILILTGSIAAGKSVLSRDLKEDFGFEVFKTHELLKELAQRESGETRKSLQAFGTSLDQKTRGAWLRDGLTDFVDKLDANSMV